MRSKGRAPLVLASASPQRRRLLRGMGLAFQVVPSGVGESFRGRDWRRLVRTLALRKAREVARRRPEAWVVGADTVVVARGKLLLKPKDKRDALRILGELNGRWHRVYTGVALVRRELGWERTGVEVSRTKARRLPGPVLARMAGRHMDKAGGYAVQDRRDPFIEKVVGPRDNVIGFPRALFRRLARDAGLRLGLLALAALPAAAQRPWGPAQLRAPAAPAPVSRTPARRAEDLRPVLERLGMELRGGALRWPGEPPLAGDVLDATLDEVEYLEALPRGARRRGTENHLSDFERHRLGVRFFEPELKALSYSTRTEVVDEKPRWVLVAAGGEARMGQLDRYLHSLEEARRTGAPYPPFRSLTLEAAEPGGRWSPALAEARLGEHVSVTLVNRRTPGSAPVGFRLEGRIELRMVPPGGGTIFSFVADRAGDLSFYDPADRARGEGVLRIRPAARAASRTRRGR